VGWRQVQLAEVVTAAFGGGTPSTKNPRYWDGGIPWTTSAYLNGLYLERGAKNITKLGLDESSAKLVPKGNLLVGTRVGVGKVATNLIDVAISQDLTGLIIDHEKADIEYLAYALMSDGPQAVFRSQTRGTTIKGIPREDLLKISVPLPPSDEQRRIAQVLSTIQRATGAQDKVIAAAHEVKRSLMKHLFTYGPVPSTETAHVPPKETEIGPAPKHWELLAFGLLIAEGPQNGLYKPQSLYGGGTPIVRINDYENVGGILASAANRVRLAGAEMTTFQLNRGDILINRVNSLSHLGKAALVGGLREPTVFESNMMRLAVNPQRVLPEYAFRVLCTPAVRERFRAKSKRAVAQSSINQQDVKSLPFPLPPLAEQQNVVTGLSTVEQKIAAEEKRKAALQALFKTMLHHLMTGKIRTRGI
jgi:type I restriction enzyme S subunit